MSNANAFSTFPGRLIEFRRIGRLSRSALARAMGFANASTVQAWETGLAKAPRDLEDFYRRIALLAEAKPFARSPSPDTWARWLVEGGERPPITQGPRGPRGGLPHREPTTPPEGTRLARESADVISIDKVREIFERVKQQPTIEQARALIDVALIALPQEKRNASHQNNWAA